MKRKRIFKTMMNRDVQFIVNIADVNEGKVEVFKYADDNSLVPIADIELPNEMRKNAHPRELRQHILKDLRKIENYVKAKAEFSASGIALRINEEQAVEAGLLSGRDEDRRKLGAGRLTAKVKAAVAAGKRVNEDPPRKAGRPSWSQTAAAKDKARR